MSLLDERLRSTKHRRTIYLRFITFLCSKVGIGYNGIVVYQSMLYGDIIYTEGCHTGCRKGATISIYYLTTIYITLQMVTISGSVWH